jgi:Pretoxin HINT domain/Pre-toxin TG
LNYGSGSDGAWSNQQEWSQTITFSEPDVNTLTWSKTVTTRNLVNGQVVSSSYQPSSGTIKSGNVPDQPPPPPSIAETGLSLALDLIPVVGEVKGVMEAVWGRDLVTGQELEPWERLLGVIPLVSDAKKVFNAGDNIVKAADAARDAAKAAEVAGDVTTASKAADAADAAVAANRRGLEDAQATGDASKVTQAQTNLQKTEDAAREAREAANRSCFVAGTLILTPAGYRVIETLQAGDIVLAGNPETGEVKPCQVLQTFEREVSQVLDVQVGNETITCTAEHPFWVQGKGWVGAGDLVVGDLLTTQTGAIVQVAGIEPRAEQVKVYNFEVEEFHTYFVSKLGILVHNTCDPNLSPLSQAADAEIAPAKLEKYSMDPNNVNNEGKWKAFDELGYDVHTESGRKSGAQDVIEQIRRQIQEKPANPARDTAFGSRFTVDIPIQGPNGRTGTLQTTWQYDNGSETPRLITNWLKTHK